MSFATRLLACGDMIQYYRDKAKAEKEGTEVSSASDYWGDQGAGCLVLARDTGRILWPRRSLEVREPLTWGSWGGAVDEGETPKTTVLRELREETGYTGKVLSLEPLLVFKDGDFKYYNFLVVVPNEFRPVLNWETSKTRWADFDAHPKPLHPGLKTLFADSASVAKIRAFSPT